jgi:hypothetical protein
MGNDLELSYGMSLDVIIMDKESIGARRNNESIQAEDHDHAQK